MSSLIGALRVTLGLDTAAFEKGASAAERRTKKIERSIESFGKRMQGLGAKLSLAVTAPLVAFGVASVKAAAESRDAMGQVDAALKSMGNAAGRTGDQLAGLATGIMRKSLYDDDDVLRKVTANLLTFGKISGVAFDQAQQAAVDLSARLGTDLQSSAIMVGKALNDPIKGVTALTRVGVSFTAQQQAQIKAMAAAGDVAGAQKIILGELNKQYGGSAEAALRAAGPMAQLKHRMDDLSETVGGVLLTALDRLAPYLTKAADWFQNLSPGMQTAIVAGGALAAALGPVLIGLGALISLAAPVIAGLAGINAAILATEGLTFAGYIAGWGAALGSLAASALAVAAPLAAVAAAGYLIYRNWDKIGPVFESYLGRSKAIGDSARRDFGAVTQSLTENDAAMRRWREGIVASLNSSNAAMQQWRAAAIAGFKSIASSAGEALETLATLPFKFALVGRDIVLGLANGIRNSAGAALQAAKDLAGRLPEWVKSVLGIRSPSRVFMEIGDFIGQGLAIGIAGGEGRVTAATKKLTEAARVAAEEVRTLFARLFPEIEAANSYKADLATIARAPFSDDAKRAARLRLGREFTGTAGDNTVRAIEGEGPLVDADKLRTAAETTADAMAGLRDRAKVTTVAVAKSFKDMADATVQSLGNLANAVKGGGFLDILSAVIGLGVQLGSIGAFGKTIAGRINAPKVPGYAGGTNFHPGGLAVVGERGPELLDLPRGSRVTPNHALGGGARHYHFTGNLMTPEFWAMIRAGDERAARSGAGLAQAQFANSSRWSLSS